MVSEPFAAFAVSCLRQSTKTEAVHSRELRDPAFRDGRSVIGTVYWSAPFFLTYAVEEGVWFYGLLIATLR